MKCVCKCGEASPSLRSCGSLSPCDPLVVTDRQTQFRLAHQSTCSTSRSHCRRKYDAQNGKYTILPSVSKKRPAQICHYLKHEEKTHFIYAFQPCFYALLYMRAKAVTFLSIIGHIGAFYGLKASTKSTKILR